MRQPDCKIIMPGGCSAKCGFCFKHKQTVSTPLDWRDRLEAALNGLPPTFTTLNITGGEPSESPNFSELLEWLKSHRDRWPKVVLSSNGTCLINYIDELEGSVDHVNISRHNPDDRINWNVFGCTTVPSTNELTDIVRKLGDVGIDTTLSCVMHYQPSGQWHMPSVTSFVSYAKDVCATAITMRQDYSTGVMPVGRADEQYGGVRAVSESSCPVCYSKTQIIDGMYVTWSRGVLEPTAHLPGGLLEGEPFEVIVQPDCRVTLDYAGNIDYKPVIQPEIGCNGHALLNLLDGETQAQVERAKVVGEQLRLERQCEKAERNSKLSDYQKGYGSRLTHDSYCGARRGGC